MKARKQTNALNVSSTQVPSTVWRPVKCLLLPQLFYRFERNPNDLTNFPSETDKLILQQKYRGLKVSNTVSEKSESGGFPRLILRLILQLQTSRRSSTCTESSERSVGENSKPRNSRP